MLQIQICKCNIDLIVFLLIGKLYNDILIRLFIASVIGLQSTNELDFNQAAPRTLFNIQIESYIAYVKL